MDEVIVGLEDATSCVQAILETLGHYTSASETSMGTSSDPVNVNVSEDTSTLSAGPIIKNIQEQIALLAILTEGSGKQRQDIACAGCVQHARYNDDLILRIEALRYGWMEERSKHVQTSLDRQQLQHVVDACNVTFRKLRQSKDGFLGNELPLSQLASDTIATYCDEQRKQHWDETRAVMERKSAKMKQKARDMLKANQIFHEFALKFNHELYAYSEWLGVRRHSLQDNYQRYCQVMQEHGAKPELLYDDQEVLSEAEVRYTDAWTARVDAALKATETAQLHGLSDPFDGFAFLILSNEHRVPCSAGVRSIPRNVPGGLAPLGKIESRQSTGF